MLTKLRTVLRIAASLQNTAVVLTASVQAFSSEYHIGWLMFAWAIFALVCNFVVDVLSHYYNNDFTVEACEATGEMRLKKEMNKEITGEDFYDEFDVEIEEELQGEEQ